MVKKSRIGLRSNEVIRITLKWVRWTSAGAAYLENTNQLWANTIESLADPSERQPTNRPKKNPVKPGKTPSLAICGMLRLLVQRCIMSESICGHPPTAHTTQCNTTHKKKEKRRKMRNKFPNFARNVDAAAPTLWCVTKKKTMTSSWGGGAFRWCHYGDANWSRFRLVTETRWFLRWRPVTKNDVRW